MRINEEFLRAPNGAVRLALPIITSNTDRLIIAAAIAAMTGSGYSYEMGQVLLHNGTNSEHFFESQQATALFFQDNSVGPPVDTL